MRRALRTARPPAPFVAALAALALAAAILIGCGGDGETTSAARTETGQQEAQQKAPRAKTQGHPEGSGQKDQQGRSGSGADKQASVPAFEAPSGPSPTASGSLPNEGAKRPAPGVPTKKGTDSTVQTFGLEAPAEDRIGAARLLQAFVNARLNSDWELACSYLSDQIKAQIRALVKGEAGTAAACVQVMAALGEGVPKSALRVAADIRVLSMRIEGDMAIVIYRDGNGAPSTIPMQREEGAWKVAAVAGSALFLGA